ncbi:MAG: inorganic diphosphatase [Myxococcota bacterium]
MGVGPKIAQLPSVGSTVRVRIEVSKGGFAKRDAEGRIEFATPIPCPYNYGSIIDTVSADGEGIDAVLLGGRVRRGELRTATVRAVARFVDAGQDDPKVICSTQPFQSKDRVLLTLFFRIYSRVKQVKQIFDGEAGRTRFIGWL